MRANMDLFAYADDLAIYAEEPEEWLDEGFDDGYGVEYAVVYDDGYGYGYGYPTPRPRLTDYLHSQTVVALLLLLLFGYGLLHRPTAVTQPVSTTQEISAPALTGVVTPAAPSVTVGGDALTVVAPYANYQITQGLHGYSYGHMAIDLAAGRGEPVLSPINGTITASYLDEWGNTTLIIENEVYTVTMLHGEYSVRVGDKVSAGQQVGVESNKGYTMDMAGNLCYNREWCGNHTHLNIYDKRLRSNVNPLDLIN